MHQFIESKEMDAGTRGGVTVGLTLNHLGAAQIGQWLKFNSTVLKIGRKLAYAKYHIHSGGELVARASATLRLGEDLLTV